MSKTTKILISAVIVIMIAAGIIGASRQTNKVGVTKLGVISPLTGPVAVMGEEVMNAVKMASSTSMKLLFEDDQCGAKGALSAYMKLAAENVHIFYVTCSGSVMALAPHAKVDGNLIVTGYAGSSEIRKTGDEVIRFIPDAISVAGPMASYVSTLVASSTTVGARVGLLYEEQDYAKSVATVLRDQLGQKIITAQTYSADDNSYRTQITKLKSANIDFLLYIPTSDKAASVVYGEMKTLGFKPHIIGDVNVCGYPISPKDFGIETTCFAAGFASETQSYKDFVTRYKELYGIDSAGPFYDAVTYDIIHVIDSFEVSSGFRTSIGNLKKYLLSGVKGEMSSYEFTPNGEVVADQYLKRVEK